MTDDKVRENRLRRMAVRQGYTLHKTRRYDRRAFDYDTWRIKGRGAPRGLLSLDDVEQFLTAAPEERGT